MDVGEFQDRNLKVFKGLKRLSEDLYDAIEDGVDEEGRRDLLKRADLKLEEYDAFVADLQNDPEWLESVARDQGAYIERIRDRCAQLQAKE